MPSLELTSDPPVEELPVCLRAGYALNVDVDHESTDFHVVSSTRVVTSPFGSVDGRDAPRSCIAIASTYIRPEKHPQVRFACGVHAEGHVAQTTNAGEVEGMLGSRKNVVRPVCFEVVSVVESRKAPSMTTRRRRKCIPYIQRG